MEHFSWSLMATKVWSIYDCNGSPINSQNLHLFPTESYKIGCFAESPIYNREFNISAGDYSTSDLQPYDCATTCGYLGYRYAALQAGSFCFCANSYGTHGNSSACSTPCSGNPALICGGDQANTVYNASGYLRNFVLNVRPRDLKLFEFANVSAIFANDTGSELPSKFDIGDGSGASPALRSPLRFRSTRWGLIKITAQLNTTGPPTKAEQVVKINSPITRTRVSCPLVVRTTEHWMCRVDIFQGTESQASWQFQNGPLENISLPSEFFFICLTKEYVFNISIFSFWQ